MMVGAVTGYPVSALLFPVPGKFSAVPRPTRMPFPKDAQKRQAYRKQGTRKFPSPDRESTRKRMCQALLSMKSGLAAIGVPSEIAFDATLVCEECSYRDD